MKLTLLILAFVSLGTSVQAEEPTAAQTTQADWFSPSCPTCNNKLLIPGSANLGNSKGVFRPGTKKLKKKVLTTPVDVEQ